MNKLGIKTKVAFVLGMLSMGGGVQASLKGPQVDIDKIFNNTCEDIWHYGNRRGVEKERELVMQEATIWGDANCPTKNYTFSGVTIDRSNHMFIITVCCEGHSEGHSGPGITPPWEDDDGSR